MAFWYARVMKIFTNRFFILGNLILILAAIPVTLFFVKQQQNVRSKAAPSSKLYFTPATTTSSTTCPSFTADVMVDPGSNLVSIVTLFITYDPTKVEITQITPSTTFSTVQTPASISNGQASITLDAVGGDVTKAISQVSKVATVTFAPKGAGTAQVQFDSVKSEVLSLSAADDPSDNVLSSVQPLVATIDSNACATTTGGVTPGVTNAPPGVPSGGVPSPTATSLITPSPVVGTSITPSASGSPTLVPTAIPTAIPTLVPTAIPTAVPTTPPVQPTIADTGSLAQTVGIIAAIIITIFGGIALLAL